MAANNVVHTINPLEEIAAACSETDAMLHSDATQLVGRQPIDVEGIGIDALSISAHKMYGPKGIGALYLSRFAIKAGLVPLIDGGGQEYGFRSGTLNVAAIVGFGAACELAAKRMFEDATRLRKLAVLFMDELRGRLSDFELNGHPVDRLPGGIHLTFEGVDSRALIAAVPQVAFSDGSACETGHEPDHVIGQLGKREAAHCSIRIQIGRMTSRAEVVRSAELIAAGAQSLKHHRIARRRAGPQV
jgi:cysteine desulfurase